MEIQEILKRPDVLNVYRFGSRVYGTHNEHSDHDYIVVAKEWFDAENINIHVFSVNQFLTKINECDIAVLECLFLDRRHILQYMWDIDEMEINKENLRRSISTISSNSWVKGKKKLTVMGDYDLYAAIKSVYHSLRILDYGIQLAQDGKISSYSSMNYAYYDMIRLSTQFQYHELWDNINTKYRKIFNQMSSSFKLLCPIDKIDNMELLNDVMKKYDVKASEEMLFEILNLFKK